MDSGNHFCSWCNAEVHEGAELCEKCQAAQKSVQDKENYLQWAAAGHDPSTPVSPAVQRVKIVATLMFKWTSIVVLAVLLVGAAIFSTCSAIIGTLGTASGGAGFLVLALVGSAITYAIFLGIKFMLGVKPAPLKLPPPKDDTDSVV